MENRFLQRKRPPHFPGIDRHNQVIIHFVTVCTKNRRQLLASEEIHRTLCDAWNVSDAFMVGRYVILPDHIHLFCAPVNPGAKYMATRSLEFVKEGQLWQRDFWDTQLRNSEHYGTQWEYVRHNPVRHGLAKSPDDWPYQGELNMLDSHD